LLNTERMRPGLRITLVIALGAVAFAAAARPADANDAVLAGYQKFYGGDKAGAQRHFEQLVAGRPADLPARFGLLVVLEDRSRGNPAAEAEFERHAESFLADAERRHLRSATDDEALFYVANGYMLRARYRVNHDKGMFGAARDGAKAKRYVDAYVKRRPEHGDAYFALGTYNYYVDIAPSLVRVLRVFLFLPGGNRAEGLKQIERAYRDGSLLSFPAGMILMEVYGQFEGRTADAIATGERLAAQYPDNPLVHFELAAQYLSPAAEDYAGAAARYEALIAREDRRAEERQAKYDARQGLANARFQQWRVDEAIAGLTRMIDANPEKFTSMPNFLLQRGNYRALVDDPRAAEDAQRVRANEKWKSWHKTADEQLAWIEKRRASGEAALYAALIPGNRFAADGKWDEASAVYERVRQKHPSDPKVRYRIGRLHFARGEAQRASTELAAVIENRASPEWLKAQAMLYLARAHDLAGRRAEARRLYGRIADDHEHESIGWAAKVGLVTPYQRPKR
jgi:Tetratricopeptide repeat